MNETPKAPAISEKSRRIAKNTVFLYMRMFLMLIIGLFTSRIVLKMLGVEDVGVYNAVAAVVGSFTIVTASLSSAISRFITYGLGKNSDLHRIFSTSVLVELVLSGIILLLVETVGLWFLNCRMDIPAGRLPAANWVLQASMLMLFVNLLSVPFNAEIIAHEDMKAFAWISLVEAGMKLAVAFSLYITPADRLKTYAVMMLLVALVVRGIYSMYCRRYAECRGRLEFDRGIFKEMAGFAGWNFFGTSATLFNTQGISVLTNLFFGVAVNAARGYAVQVEGIVRQFVTSFTTALNPQITKSYAEGNDRYCHELVCKGAKYSWILMLFFAIPLAICSRTVLRLWLGEGYPPFTQIFVPLAVVASMVDMLGNSLAILEMATGNIRKYYLWVGGVAFLVFPVSWLCFALGAAPESPYIVYICVYLVLVGVKLAIMHAQIAFPWKMFVRETLVKILLVTVPAAALSAGTALLLPEGVWRLLAVCAVSTVSIAVFAYFLAATPGERAYAGSKLAKIFKPLRHESN